MELFVASKIEAKMTDEQTEDGPIPPDSAVNLALFKQDLTDARDNSAQNLVKERHDPAKVAYWSGVLDAIDGIITHSIFETSNE